jgi:3-isopropylmalate/(R)-2-methylmalate dehydratase small subunit
MTPLTFVESRAIPLALANVDTDQLIPARFMKRPRSEGYGPFLLHDLRADLASEAARLDDPIFAGAQILVARRNFGSGSSREAAVYALADYGFRCILAPSFGDIFASNAVKNGVLPAIISEADAETLLNDSTLSSGGSVHIDLAQQTVRVGNHVMKFEIEPVWKTQLLNGWDDIDMTRSYSAAIADFVTRDAQARPWAKPSLG